MASLQGVSSVRVPDMLSKRELPSPVDLDFSSLEGVPRGDAMEQAVRALCSAATKLLDEYAPVEMVAERYVEKEPHPAGQEAFTIRARLPWHKQPQTRVIIEITVDEEILKPGPARGIIHEYGEPLEAEIPVYALEEIVAEKLRAILQHGQKLEERGWSRSRARDYYDLWRVLGTFEERMDLSDFGALLRRKCAVRDVDFTGPEDFFQGAMLRHVESTWTQWLGPLVPELPPFEQVMSGLRPMLAGLVPTER
jgi:hypothetical protein